MAAATEELLRRGIPATIRDPEIAQALVDREVDAQEVQRDLVENVPQVALALHALQEQEEGDEQRLRTALGSVEEATPPWPLRVAQGAAAAMLVLLVGHTLFAALWGRATIFRLVDQAVGSEAVIVLVVLPLLVSAIAPLLRTLWRDRRRDALGVANLRHELDTARRQHREGVREALLKEAREAIDRRVKGAWEPWLPVIREAPGLRSLADPSMEVLLDRGRTFVGRVEAVGAGAIGISGPRGAGKSTLIESLCSGRQPLSGGSRLLGVMVPAPVEYDARDFVLHVYADACRGVAGRLRVDQERFDAQFDLENRSRLAASGFLLVLGLASLVAAALVVGFTSLIRTTPPTTATALVLAASGAACIWAAALLRPRPWKTVRRLLQEPRRVLRRLRWRRTEDPAPTALAEEALRQLHEIQFQQTFTSGWAGTLNVPIGGRLTADAKVNLARVQLTLPDVIARFRDFVETVASEYRVLIGIDELDKMDSSDAARRFLNDIKGIFGIRGCTYLVSISEDALSSFERRGMAIRDVFDSSLDEILRLEYLTFADARAVLRPRVIALGPASQALCHCLAGGLPRDLIRFARAVVAERADVDSRAQTIHEVARRVVGAELRGKRHAIENVATKHADAPGCFELLEWLALLPPRVLRTPGAGCPFTGPTPDSLRRACDRFRAVVLPRLTPTVDAAAGPLVRAALEMATFTYFAATLIELFQDEPGSAGLREVIETDEPDRSIDDLAAARQSLGIDPRLSWNRIGRFRRARGQDAWQPPREEWSRLASTGLSADGRSRGRAVQPATVADDGHGVT